MTRLIGGLLVTVLLGACGGSNKPPTAPPAVVKPAEGVVTVEVDPPDAEIEIDGTARGAASSLGTVALARGTHQIWRGEVEVYTQTERLRVKLDPQK